MSTANSFTDEDFHRAQREYWRQVSESDGFDIDHVTIPSSMNGMIRGLIPYSGESDMDYPLPVLIRLYAKLGIDRFNLLENKRFRLATLLKCNMLSNWVSSYYMTLFARNTDTDIGEYFQIRVDERKCGTLDVTVSIARTKVTGIKLQGYEDENEVVKKKSFVHHFHGDAQGDVISDDVKLLNCSSSDFDLSNNENSGSSQSNDISLYLELVICAHDRFVSDTILSQLQIVRVIERRGDTPCEWIKEMFFYITFSGLENVRSYPQVFEIGKHVERKAIVRRVLNLKTGYMTLMGKLCSGANSEEQSSSPTIDNLVTLLEDATLV